MEAATGARTTLKRICVEEITCGPLEQLFPGAASPQYIYRGCEKLQLPCFYWECRPAKAAIALLHRHEQEPGAAVAGNGHEWAVIYIYSTYLIQSTPPPESGGSPNRVWYLQLSEPSADRGGSGSARLLHNSLHTSA